MRLSASNCRTERRFLAAAGLLLVAAACAAAEAAPRFGRTVTLTDLGLTARIPVDATERPLPSPSMYIYRRTQGGVSDTVELYDPAEFWRRTQHGGEWTDAAGNRLVIARVKFLPPEGLPTPHAPREDIEKALAQAERSKTEFTPDRIAAWLQAFTGSMPSAPDTPTPLPRRFSDLILFEWPSGGKLACVFRLNRRTLGFAAASDSWYAAILDYGRTHRAEALAAMQEQFLEHIAPAAPARRPPSGGADSPQFADRARRPAAAPAAALDESRRDAAESIRNLRGWWTVSTERYVLLSNLEPSARGFVRTLQSDLEALRNAFERTIPPDAPTATASVIRIFASTSEYEDYVPPEQRWTSGLWMPARGELVVRPFPGTDRGAQYDAMRRVVFHEAFHQYIHYALDRRITSAWFNEGYASFFEQAVIRPGRPVNVAESEPHVARILEAIRGKRMDLKRLATLSYDGFYDADAERRSDHYALAWGLVYFLQKGAPATRSIYAGLPAEYLERVRATGDGDLATREVFARVDMERLHKEMAAFWTTASSRRAAERINLPR